MIEGNLKDVSLPGLLQFLGAEVSKNYRINIASKGQTGEIYVCKGFVVCAAYGLLEGEDALCEFLAWRDGTFFVETLTPQVEVKKNLKRAIPPGSALAENITYLFTCNVGLNTTIVASQAFRSTDWQESVRRNPLEREDFVVVGWLAEGRTMRQAVREFNFDISQAAAILVRLLKTNSVEICRPSTQEIEDDSDAVLPADPVLQRFITTGGQQGAAANFAQAAARALSPDTPMVGDAFISTAYRQDLVVNDPEPQQSSKMPSDNKKPFINPLKKIGMDLAQARASMEARLRLRTFRNSGEEQRTESAPVKEPTAPVTPNTSLSGGGSFGPVPEVTQSGPADPSEYALRAKLALQGLTSDGVFGADMAQTAPAQSEPQILTEASFAADSALDTSDMLSPITSDSRKPHPSQFGRTPSPAQAFTTGDHAVFPSDAPLQSEFPTAAPTASSPQPDAPAASSPQPDAPAASPPAPPSVFANQPIPLPARSGASAIPAITDSTAGFAPMPQPTAARMEVKAQLQTDSTRMRTEAMPMVTIDIDRLLQATFSPTQFGKLALKNPALDQFRRQTLMDVEAGRTLSSAISEGNRPPAAVLNSYRYCLDRGYVETADPVVPLTVDLLLGRMELDQYLLQRRRLTGDQLRDLVEIARKEGVKLSQVLVRSGYLTQGDLNTLEREQNRFSLK